jgi:hypothetical protein
MIRLSQRDPNRNENTQMWIDQEVEGLRDEGNEYYKNIEKVKKFQKYYDWMKRSIDSSIQHFNKQIGLYPDIEILYIKNSNAVAMYRSQTSHNVPIISLGLDTIIKWCKKEAKENGFSGQSELQSISDQISISILHELGHAMVDELDNFGYQYDNYGLFGDEEAMVEEFARDLYDDNYIIEPMRRIISDIKKCRKGGTLKVSKGNK